MLFSSVVFFIVSSGLLTLYMVATTLIIYLGALWLTARSEAFVEQSKRMEKAERKLAKKQFKETQRIRLVLIIVAVLSFLIVMKYCNLGIEIANLFSRVFHLSFEFNRFSIILPLGISYYTLMSVSYVNCT